MSQFEKLLFSVLSGRNDQRVSFDDLCKILIRVGFELRIKGSHHIFYKTGVPKF